MMKCTNAFQKLKTLDVKSIYKKHSVTPKSSNFSTSVVVISADHVYITKENCTNKNL